MTPERSPPSQAAWRAATPSRNAFERSAPPTCSGSAGPKSMADGALRRSSSSSSSKRRSGVNAPHPAGHAQHGRADALQLRHRRAEARVPARDPGRHGRVRDRLLRTVGAAATWPRCAPRRCATATITSSTARRCSPAARRTPTTSGWRRAPIPDAKKHKGISIFIVPTSSPGFSWTPLHTMPAGLTFYTFYDDVRVPATAIVGGENEGWRLITTQLNFERAALGNMGALEPLFEKTLTVGADHRTRRRPRHRPAVGAAGAGPSGGAGRRLQDHEPAGERGDDQRRARHGVRRQR